MNKTIMVPVLLVLLVVGSVFASAQLFGAAPASQANNGKRLVTVSGSYSMNVAPDKAEFSTTIESEAKTAKEAVDKNRQIVAGVIGALKAAGVDAKDIKTENFYVYKKEEPVYPDGKTMMPSIYPQPYKTQVVGWVAQNTVRVTTTNLDKTGSFIDVASNAGATGFNGVTFSLSDAKQKELETTLLKGAAQNAKSKADALATALGARVGAVQSISESSPVVYPMYAKNVFAEAGMSQAPTTPIEPGQLQTSVSVYVSFELA